MTTGPNLSTGIIGASVIGGMGIEAFGVSTIENQGMISGYGEGVCLADDGLVTNLASATIAATGDGGVGVQVCSVPGTLSNAGLITASSTLGYAVLLLPGGTVTNLAGGVMEASAAEGIGLGAHGAATVTNAGIISGDFNGICFTGGGIVTNLAGGAITATGTAGIGVQICFESGTVSNAGTIGGAGGTAVVFSGGYTQRLIVSPGAVFIGNVDGGNTIGSGTISTLELVSSASVGTISGLGSSFTNFADIAVDTGAQWALTGTNTLSNGITLTNSGQLSLSASAVLSLYTLTSAVGGTVTIGSAGTLITQGLVAANEKITFATTAGLMRMTYANFLATTYNFAKGDQIALSGVTNVTGVTLNAGNILHVSRSVGTEFDVRFDSTQSFSAFQFTYSNSTVSNAAFLSLVDAPCFAEGSGIATPAGYVAVESLKAGDLVLSPDGSVHPVRWIGRRRVDLVRHPNRRSVEPVHILPDAIDAGLPNRRLTLSPEHSVYIDGKLLPVRLLVNGTTIRRDPDACSVTYYHVELDRHGLLLADGLPVESWLDTGNRGMFENGGEVTVLHPDFRPNLDAPTAQPCIPFTHDRETAEPIWRAIAARAARLMPSLAAPPRHGDVGTVGLQVDGRALRPVRSGRDLMVFVLPGRRGPVTLTSTLGSPADDNPWGNDQRRLGVALREMTLRQGEEITVIAPDHPMLSAGWWDAETAGTSHWRWTNGAGVVPLPAGGPAVLEVQLIGYEAEVRDLAAA